MDNISVVLKNKYLREVVRKKEKKKKGSFNTRPWTRKIASAFMLTRNIDALTYMSYTHLKMLINSIQWQLRTFWKWIVNCWMYFQRFCYSVRVIFQRQTIEEYDNGFDGKLDFTVTASRRMERRHLNSSFKISYSNKTHTLHQYNQHLNTYF